MLAQSDFIGKKQGNSYGYLCHALDLLDESYISNLRAVHYYIAMSPFLSVGPCIMMDW